MQRAYSVILGLALMLLGIVGLSVEEERHLFDLMNVDVPLDVLRLLLGTTLLIAGFIYGVGTRLVLGLTGIIYLGTAALGVVDPMAGGALPTGLTGFDIVFHLVLGLIALALAAPRTSPQPSMGTEHNQGVAARR